MWHVWERKEVHAKVLVGKSEGKGALETPRRRWEDNIEIDLKKL
jgi:hypothetical protein